MPRSMADPNYVYTPWPGDRQRLARKIAERSGAPTGCCTVRGVHVPFEHGKVLHYWVKWIENNHGKQEAVRFVLSLKAKEWAGIDRLKALWDQQKVIAENRRLIRALEREMWRGY